MQKDSTPVMQEHGGGVMQKDSYRKKPLNKPLKKGGTTRLAPPTLEEVSEYCRSRNNGVDPQKFFDYFNAGDWKDAKGQPVCNWKQKVITWEGQRSGKDKVHQQTEQPCKDIKPFVPLSELVEYPPLSGIFIPRNEVPPNV